MIKSVNKRIDVEKLNDMMEELEPRNEFKAIGSTAGTNGFCPVNSCSGNMCPGHSCFADSCFGQSCMGYFCSEKMFMGKP